VSSVFWTPQTPVVSPFAQAFIPVRVQGSAADGSLDTFAQISLADALGGVTPSDIGPIRATSAYAFPPGSVKKEALFAALAQAGHLADLLANLPALYDASGNLNAAAWQLQYASVVLPTDAGALFVKSRYYASDATGFTALFTAAGSGNTSPLSVATAPVTQDLGTSSTEVPSQAAVTAALAGKVGAAGGQFVP
jgi:hypothetical protein